MDTILRRKLKQPEIPLGFDPAEITEYINWLTDQPGTGIIAQLHGRLARVLNSDNFRPIKDEFPNVMTYNINKSEETNTDVMNFILSGRPKNAQEPLLEQLKRLNMRLNDIQLPRGKISSHLWKFVGGFELAKKHELDVVVQFDDDIYAALSFVLMNQIPSDQLKTVAMAVVLENPSTRFLTKEQRVKLGELGIFFAHDLMSGAQETWERISKGEYRRFKKSSNVSN